MLCVGGDSDTESDGDSDGAMDAYVCDMVTVCQQHCNTLTGNRV